MTFNPLKLALAVFTLLAFQAHAQWRSEEIGQVEAFNSTFTCFTCTKGLVNNTYFISLTDTLEQKLYSLGRRDNVFPGRMQEDLNLEGKHFANADGSPRRYRAAYWLNSQEIAPLVVYFASIFEDSGDLNTYEAVKLLLRAGNHVLVIDNPLSAGFMNQNPVAAPAQFEAEAEAGLAIARAFVKSHQGRIGKVKMAGASYGAFVAAVAVAKDSASSKPLINGQTTLIFPPLNMKRSVDLLDAMITSYHQSYTGASPSQLIGLAFQLGLQGMVGRMQEQYRADEKAGFRARSYTPRAAYRLSTFKTDDEAVMSGVNFWRIITEYIQQRVEFYASPDASLQAWIERARAAGNTRVRVLTTADDWLNTGADLKTEFPQWFQNNEHLLVRETGGHAGMVISSWFAKFVTTSMRD